jgi:hypothetical protein
MVCVHKRALRFANTIGLDSYLVQVSMGFEPKIDWKVSKPYRVANDWYWWTERDLNPRLPRCERGDHTELIYRPISEKTP